MVVRMGSGIIPYSSNTFLFPGFPKGGKVMYCIQTLLLPCRGVAMEDMSTHLSIAINH